MTENSVVATENQAKVVATFFAWWRSDIPIDLSYKYWRDVHGVWAARTPGMYQYRQLRLDPVDPTMLSTLNDIELDLPTEDQPNGIAHIAYSSAFMANLLRQPFALKQANEDDGYFVSRNTYQRAVLPLSRTYVDKTDDPHRNGFVERPRYVLAFIKNKDVSDEDFSDYLVNMLCKPWSQQHDVQRLRLERLEPHVNAPTSPQGVSHTWTENKQYQAWIELELSEGISLSSLFDNSTNHSKHVSAIHAYPVKEVYTIVYGGKPTLVGLRGYPAVQIIEAVGADFQKSQPVLKFTYGAVINGASFFSQSFYILLISAVIIGILLYFL